ncbi:MAG: sigma-54 dependent transcriptional regulator [Candidatus Sumerlaeota bacterium]|nr:sigma-54 dependent transcriptional regulator [Candidatus Sumerlaeota bacterium]
MKTPPTVLIVDDVDSMRSILRIIVEHAGMEAIEAGDGQTALRLIEHKAADVVLLDVRMPGMDGHEVLRRAKELDSSLPVIMITAYGGIQDAIHTVKQGAIDYLTKPFSNEEIIQKIIGALDETHCQGRSEHPETESEANLSLCERMGHGEEIQALASEVQRVAPTAFSVLIIGETGAGKEVIAQAIHAQSHRASKRFVAVDCGAIPETLIESELFGHEKGSFTGADNTRHGKFEAAAEGTLFLDEISNLPLSMQSKLLRALQEKQFYRVGASTPLQADARIVAATNQDLSKANPAVFRRDLYHRLNEYAIRVPPLRERREDIPHLVNRFLRMANDELGKKVAGVSDAAMDVLLQHDWPGNVRELRNIIRRAVLLAEETIDLPLLGPLKSACVTPLPECAGARLSLKEISKQHSASAERTALQEVLARTGGNKALAARILQIDYKTIHAKIRLYGLSMNGGKHEDKGNERQYGQQGAPL